MNHTAIKQQLTNTLMLLMEDVPTKQKEAIAADFVSTVTDMLAFHREQGAAEALAGLHDVYTHPEDLAVPEHWHRKPFARMTRAAVPADLPVGTHDHEFWAFAEPEHQKGTVLADLVELAENVKSLYKSACEARGATLIEYGTDFVSRKDVDAIAGAFGCEHG